MKTVTIFCASSIGVNEVYASQAALLGHTLAKRNIEIVYGGANIGLMGAVANAALNAGGKVIGVIPEFLKTKEIAHEQLTQLIVVKNMHQRKTKMHELCDAVIALPGGFGTLEELFEMLTWAQLGLHNKPIALLNINGFYNPLISLIQTMVDNGFLKPVNQQMLLVSNNINELIEKMENYIAPSVGKWITKDKV